MALIVSLTSGGSDIGTTPIDLGDIAVGSDSTENAHISHDYANKISDVKLFFGQKTGNYGGDFLPITDWNEIIDWATNSDSDGIFLSKDAGSTFTQLKTNSLDSQSTGLLVGEIGVGEEVHTQIKCHVPSGEDTGGKRQIDYNIYYLYTS